MEILNKIKKNVLDKASFFVKDNINDKPLEEHSYDSEESIDTEGVFGEEDFGISDVDEGYGKAGAANDNQPVSVQGRIIRELLTDFNQNNFLRTHFRDNERGKSEMEKPFKYPERFEVTSYELTDFQMEFLRDKYYDNGYVILQLHGGGYVGRMKNSYRAFAGYYSEVGGGASVLTIDYRCAPEHVFPAALIDAYEAYHFLLRYGYTEDRIIVAGDSAGGGLSMALCHYLKEKGEKMPAGVVTMSPWTDLTCSGPSYTENYEIDPLFGNTRDSLVYDSVYIGEADPRNPLISPQFGDFSGFPPMLIQVGSHEILKSDSEIVYDKAKKAGVKVRLSVYEGMFHVFQMGLKLMPESRKAWAEIGKYFEAIGIQKKEDAVARLEEKKTKPEGDMSIALYQMHTVWEDKEENLLKLDKTLDLIKQKGVNLILLPEMSFTGFSMNIDKTCDGKESTIERVAELAEKYSIAIGFGYTKRVGYKAENHYALVDKDRNVIFDYAKIHPFSYAQEDRYFVGGAELCYGNVCGMTISPTICYDLRFPELYQQLSKKAEMILVPANWPKKRRNHFISLLVARAIENQTFVAGINCGGSIGGLEYSGDSMLVSPNGEILVPAEFIMLDDKECEQIAIYKINNNVQAVRKAFPVKNDRREDLYYSFLSRE